jgi:hypothetical protein
MRPSLASEHGTSLIETAIAVALLLVVMAGLLSMAALATTLTENQGHLGARTTEYAQDKMEQLLALTYGDASSNTAVFPATPAGGTGLAVGGSADPAVVVAGYVDWLNEDGDLLASVGTLEPADWFYKRVWQIANPAPNLKQVTVTTTVRRSIARAQVPRSTVTAIKTFPF